MQAETISIVVPVYHGGKAFVRCLEGLKRLEPAPLEIIVVADGESDGSWRIAPSYGARLEVLPVNVGAAGARNAGARLARGSLLFFVDADVVLAPDSVQKALEAFERDPGIDALIGSYDRQPGHPAFLSQYKNLLHHYVHQTSNPEASTFWGACGVIRRRVFEAVGGFHEGYPGCSIEDIELGYCLKRRGHRIRLEKELQCTHLKEWTPRSLLYTDIFLRAIPWTELLLRQTMPLNDLNLKLSSRLSVAASWVGLAALLSLPVTRSGGLVVMGACGLSLLALNLPVYRFFWKERGAWFTLKVIPWHWLYFFYSGAAFAYVRGREYLRPASVPERDAPELARES